MKITNTEPCYPGTKNLGCPELATRESEFYLPPKLPQLEISKCFPGSTDINCIKKLPKSHTTQPTPKVPPACYLNSADPTCQRNSSTEASTLTSTSAKRTSAPKCYPGSTDSECRNLKKASTTPKPPMSYESKATSCYPGSKESHCSLSSTRAPATYLPPLNSHDPKPQTKCYPRSIDLACQQNLATKANISKLISASTSSAPQCYPGSTNSQCQITNIPSTTVIPSKAYDSKTKAPCYSGSKDSQCSLSSTREPATYLPPFTSRTPTPQTKCYPGSTDLSCQQNPTTEVNISNYISASTTSVPQYSGMPSTTATPTIPFELTSTKSTAIAMPCYLGTANSLCPEYSTNKPSSFTSTNEAKSVVTNITVFNTLVTPITIKPFTIPTIVKLTEQSTPCYPGSNDKSCPEHATRESESYLPPDTPQPLKCLLGSTDIQCMNYNIKSTESTNTIAAQCYPGSINPNCINPNDGFTGPQYLPPFATVPVRVIRQLKNNFIQQINELTFLQRAEFKIKNEQFKRQIDKEMQRVSLSSNGYQLDEV